jgi:hypothetical protein
MGGCTQVGRARTRVGVHGSEGGTYMQGCERKEGCGEELGTIWKGKLASIHAKRSARIGGRRVVMNLE